MISKHVPANSFYHTCRYICSKPGAELLLAEGVRGHDYKLMADDFLLQQQLRPSKTQACFHSILSFYPGEKPSDDLMKEIAEKYLKELGIVNTQYAISKHTDKAHLHLHIVGNMVNNQGKSISDSYMGLRGKKAAQRLTEEYKLIPALEKNLALTNLEALSKLEADKYKIYQAIAQNLPHCLTMAALESRLLKLGIETQYKYKGQTQEKQGVSFKIGNSCFKGSKVDRKCSLAGLEKTLKQQRKSALEQQQKQEQYTYYEKRSFSQKNVSAPAWRANIPEGSRKILSVELAKTQEKHFDNTLHPPPMNENIPYQFLPKKKRKKKKSMGL